MIVELKLKKSLSALAGYSYGEDIYSEQVESELSNMTAGDKIIIKIPDHIEYLASSFVQGFFSKLIEKMGFTGIEKYVDIESDNENITKENVISKLFEGTRN